MTQFVWRALGIAALLLGTSTVGASAEVVAVEPHPAAPAIPIWKGERLPTPPAQGSPWHGDASALSQATERIFAAGMADPRTLPYRAIHVAVGNAFGGRREAVATHGWVFGGDKFAVCWNGLVYPTLEVGAAANVRADVTATLAANVRDHFSYAFSEEEAVSVEKILPLKALMLERLGESALARRLLSPGDDAKPSGRLWEPLTGDWVWATYDRALCAQMRGDDDIARCCFELLAVARPRVLVLSSDKEEASMQSAFWQSIAALLTDQKRRASGKDEPPATDEVAHAIWDLQNSVNIAGDARVKKLVGLGDRAVDPLLSALETEHRFTRSVGFFRSFARFHDPIPVADAEVVALEAMLQTSFREERITTRKELVASIRVVWNKNRSVTPAERPYFTLRDDNATSQRWLEAAEEITRSTNVERAGNWTRTYPLKPGERAALAGEALRAKREPSVSQLLAHRSNALALATGHARSESLPGELALCLAKWDAHAAHPVVMARLRELTAQPYPPFENSRLAPRLYRAIEGDSAADDLYIGWLKRQSRDTFGSDYAVWFAPLWKRAAVPKWQTATRALFADPKSPWVPLVGKGGNGGHNMDTDKLVSLPLITLPAFNAAIRSALTNRAVCGRATLSAPDQVTYQMLDGSSGSRGIPVEKAGSIPVGSGNKIRVADFVAFQLASSWEQHGAPPFALYWRQSRRDAALAAMANWLLAKKNDRQLVAKWQADDQRHGGSDSD